MLRKLSDALRYLEEGLMASAVLIVVVINFMSIFTREINIGIQFGQAQEIMLLMFVWITFLGIPLAARRKAHLGLSLLTDALPPRIRWWVAHFALLVSLTFLTLVGYYGVKMVQQEYLSRQTTPSLGLLMWPFGMAIVVSMGLTILRMLEVAYDDLWSGRSEEVTSR